MGNVNKLLPNVFGFLCGLCLHTLSDRLAEHRFCKQFKRECVVSKYCFAKDGESLRKTLKSINKLLTRLNCKRGSEGDEMF